ASGLSILVKRVVLKKIREFSNPDDYLSNLLVSMFHGVSAAALIEIFTEQFLFIYATVLLIYIPIGKLRHVVFFFTSRIHLGIFYGWRGVWPAGRRKE
ncbi:MAG: hypothetical protein JSV24_01755, partial [Bacteroidales bacterium]